MRVSEMQVCADLCGQRLVVVVPDERHVVRKRVNVTAKVKTFTLTDVVTGSDAVS